MKKAFVPLALTLALGLAACGKSEAPTPGGDNVVLNDEDAVGTDNFSVVDPLGNGSTDADLGNAADLSGANTSLGNGL